MALNLSTRPCPETTSLSLSLERETAVYPYLSPHPQIHIHTHPPWISKLHSTFLADTRATSLPPRLRHRIAAHSTKPHSNSTKTTLSFKPKTPTSHVQTKLPALAVETPVATSETDIESLFPTTPPPETTNVNAARGIPTPEAPGFPPALSVLKDVTWEVKKGDKVGLVGVNGAGKTTQMRMIAGLEEPDSGNVIKAKSNMSQEFEVSMSKTVREEFMSAFKEEMEVMGRLDKVHKALESAVESRAGV